MMVRDLSKTKRMRFDLASLHSKLMYSYRGPQQHSLSYHSFKTIECNVVNKTYINMCVVILEVSV